MIRSIDIYLRENNLLFNPELITRSGGRFSPPVFVISSDDENKKIGELALQTFEYSKEADPPSSYDKNLLKPLLNAAKVKSYSNFVKGTKMCSVTMKEGRIYFLPLKNTGMKSGFEFLVDKMFDMTIDVMSPDELGILIKKTISMAE
jgi:hypothetical protein